MSFDFHHDKSRYFEYQYLNSKNYLLPFIQQDIAIGAHCRVLEIGCAEGGVLKAFTELGCSCVGVELSPSKVENAKKFMYQELEKGLVQFICRNIYEVDFENEFRHAFDIILLKDTIEHIHDQQKLISHLKVLLRPGGLIYFGFPLWSSPWGGHQQVCKSKILTLLPYFHLLPAWAYRRVLALFGETQGKIDELLEIKETGISSQRFEKIIHRTGYKILNKQFYLVNPIYLYKFGWKPRTQFSWITAIPYLRDCVSTTVYYTVSVV